MIPINLDISTIILYFLMCLAGDFKRVILSFFIILTHEMGHLFFLKIFQVQVDKLTIYPFGGLLRTSKLINFSPFKELLIAMAGILNQLILYFVILILYRNNLINTYTYNLFLTLNTSLILFNIIPIYPLDGYIILSSIFNIFIPYLKSNIISLIISLITLIIFILYSYNHKINSIFVISFLIYKIYNYLKDYKYLQNKFLLERIMYDIPYNKIIYLNTYSPYYIKLNKYYYFNYQKEQKIIKNNYIKYKISHTK